jgi:mono/diheme cytochrome c family protein
MSELSLPSSQPPSHDPHAHPDPIMDMHQAAMREMSDPVDGVTATPVPFLLACFFFCFWGGFYISEYKGEWSGDVFNENYKPGMAAPAAAPVNPMVLGQEIFNTCTQCHQSNGLGIPGQYPPLVASEFVTGDSRRLTAILLNGANGPFVVNGQAYNSKMPAWRDQYNDEELAAVMTYIRASWGNKAAPVTKESVAQVRGELKDLTAEWSMEQLNAWAAKK